MAATTNIARRVFQCSWLGSNRALRVKADEFEQRGIVHFDPCRRMQRWLVEANRRANEAYRSDGCAYEYEDSWVQFHGLSLALPPHRLFHQFLSKLFPGNRQLNSDRAHLSSLDPGYPRSNEHRRNSLGKHVDGAISEGKVMWHGVIVGVLLTDVLQENCGNPVSWPGSHHELRQAFKQLGPFPTEVKLSQLISDQCTTKITSQPEQLIARAGTITIMDHALHHGMAPNESTTIRHAVYYRLPWQGTNAPEQILDTNYFCRSAIQM